MGRLGMVNHDRGKCICKLTISIHFHEGISNPIVGSGE